MCGGFRKERAIMNKKEMGKFKKALLKIREEVTGEISTLKKESGKSQKDISGDLSGYSFHMADVASDHFDREFALNLASEEQGLVYEIDEALQRMKEHKFGRCLKCGKKIKLKRLQAVPYTKYCIACQKQEEKRQKS
jgi:RNA polymerase-binding protein DksA